MGFDSFGQMTSIPGAKDETDIPGTHKTIESIGEPLPYKFADLQLPAGKSHMQKDYIYFTALNWSARTFDLNDLQDVIDSFSHADDVWSHTFLNCTIS